uniref:Uncharacterized protein n=1 Tax=Opuntia streptacantha TaxID=393608 RepID=A0A7C8Z4R0_OPUST
MEEEEEGGEFSPLRCSSFRFGRSSSSILFSDSIPSESARFTAYHSLSKSMRLNAESSRVHSTSFRKKNNQPWRILSRIFSRRKSNGPNQIIREAKVTGDDRSSAVKKRSSWLPDPNRRWPVQGW